MIENNENIEDSNAGRLETGERYLSDITAYDRKFNPWLEEAKRIVKRYRNETGNSGNSPASDPVTVNILWSNVQTQLPALYSATPLCEVVRRVEGANQVTRLACIGAERLGRYLVDVQKNDFDVVLNQVVLDRLLGGRGTAWARYEADFKKSDTKDPETGEALEQAENERVIAEYIQPEDFKHNIAKTWADVRRIYRRLPLTKREIRQRFGAKVAAEISYSSRGSDGELGSDRDEFESVCSIYECWDLNDKRVYWISPEYPDRLLKEKDDFLKLGRFFPCPMPLFATLTNECLIPRPDYALYRRLVEDLNQIAYRKSQLTKVCKLVGVSAREINDLMQNVSRLSDGELLPVANFLQFKDTGGLKGAIEWFPIKEVSDVIVRLSQLEKEKLEQIYEVTGMSDIVRGASKATETATAQQIKSQFVSVRLSNKQKDVQRFAKELIAIMVEIALEHFSDQTLAEIMGFEFMSQEDQQIFPEALALLKNDKFRTFRIDIETDSTIQANSQQERQDRQEYIGALGQFLQQAYGIAAAEPALKPFLLEVVAFGSRGFKAGRSMEGELERTIEMIREQEKTAAEQPPGPDPAQMEAQAAQQAETQKMQQQAQLAMLQVQADQKRLELELQAKQQEALAKSQVEAQKLEAKYAEIMAKVQVEMQKLELKSRELDLKESESATDQATKAIETLRPTL